MGENTTEHIFIADPALVARFVEDSGSGEEEAVFDAVGEIWETAKPSLTFRGYANDFMVFLPWIIDLYGDRNTEKITEYTELDSFLIRTVTGRATRTQAKGVAALLERVKRDPARLLPLILDHLKDMHALSLKALNDLPAESTGFWAQKSREMADETGRAVREFSMTGEDVVRLMTLGRPNGFANGEPPAALRAFDNQHTPRSSLGSSLAQSFSFLQLLATAYKTAAETGHDVLHFQTYG